MNDLTKQVVEAATPYLSSNAERFILRQITSHLNATGDQLTTAQLDDLAKWVEISASLLIDKAKAKELSEKILTFK